MAAAHLNGDRPVIASDLYPAAAHQPKIQQPLLELLPAKHFRDLHDLARHATGQQSRCRYRIRASSADATDDQRVHERLKT